MIHEDSKFIEEYPEFAQLDEYSGLLPVGLCDEHGTIHRLVRFRPEGMIGFDEHKMSDPKLNNNGAKAITALLGNGLIQSVGSIDKVNSDLMRRLVSADRDFLLLRSRQITFGNKATYTHKCANQNCKAENEVTIDFEEDVTVKYLDDTHPRVQGQPVFSFELPLGVNVQGARQRLVTFRLPTGVDAERLSHIARQNMAEANTSLFQSIILSIGSVNKMTPAVFSQMSVKDRHAFNKHLAEITPGPSKSVKIVCAGCGTEIDSDIPLKAYLSDSL